MDEKEKGVRVGVESQNSVKFRVNAKMQWSGKCKCYAVVIEDAYKKAEMIGERIEEKIRAKNSPKM